ncbi:MAG: hypothetical protein FJY97_19190, partial [candidate division Zixibacteria bacterium]|nr:hypothetical protein [candidate division Zixibacteria bacterium]
TPEHAGPDFHTHHAIVEYASFGVTALTLLGESPDAGRWIEAVIAKFERDLLPRGLAEDGAQVEGGSFWASTMQYRLMFMDALLRVTGHDLFSPYERFMKDTHALAGIVATHTETDLFDHASFMLQPSYAQLDYYAPVLLALSRFYDRPQCRRLALWDQTLGGLQRTRFVTPNGEHLLFSFGGYAYLWYTDGPVDIAPGSPMAWHFPSVDEAYLRDGWEPDGMAAGVRRGEMVLHAGGRPFLVESNPWQQPPIPRKVNAISDNGRYAEIVCGDDTNRFCLALTRPGCLSVERQSAEPWVWRCAGDPVVEGDTIVWPDGVRLIVQAGILTPFEPRVFTDTLSVANGLLVLPDPAPVSWTQVTVTPPEDGNIVLKCKR